MAPNDPAYFESPLHIVLSTIALLLTEKQINFTHLHRGSIVPNLKLLLSGHRFFTIIKDYV